MTIRLSRKEDFALMNYTSKEYEAAGLSDREFAAKATAELNMPHLSESHVKGCRVALEIPATGSRVSPKAQKLLTEAVETRFKALESRLKALEDRIEVYCTGSRK